MIPTPFPSSLALAGKISKTTTLSKLATLLVGIALLWLTPRGLAQDGTVVAWGDNRFGQTWIPSGLRDVVAIASGEWHHLALKADGKLVSWGARFYVPPEATNIVAIGTGGYHNMAVRADGTVLAWGADDYGQSSVPPGLSNVVEVKGGWVHSLALKSDGTVIGWGRHTEGQTNAPPGLSNVVAIASGEYHNLALKADGTVVAWGNNRFGQSAVPVGLSNVVAVAGGGLHSLALKADGTVVAWGWNEHRQIDVPAGLSNVVAIAGGAEHSLAVRSDGTVVGWGANDGWAHNDPNCEIIGAPCERKYTGQISPPSGLNNVVAIAGGVFHSIALKSLVAPVAPTLSTGAVDETSVNLNWGDVPNESRYRLEARVGASEDWVEIATPSANVTKYQHNGLPSGTTIRYRLQAYNGGGASPYSAEVTVTTLGELLLPPIAPALQAQALSHAEVALSWTAVENATGFVLQRRDGVSDIWANLSSFTAGAASHTDAQVSPSTGYAYRIAATNAAGASGYSAEVSVTTAAAPVLPPSAPNLQATAISPTEALLEWSDLTNETSFIIEWRRDGATTAEGTATIGPDTTTFTALGLAPESAYVFRIRATNSGGDSAWTEASITTPARPPEVQASVSFVRVDDQTSGLWPLEFGADGKWLASETHDLPAGVEVDGLPEAPVVWAEDSSEARALISAGGTNRVAAGWSGAPLTFSLSVPRGEPRRIALYFVDWRRTGASQEISIRDTATGTNLDTRSIEAFGEGRYLAYDIEGNLEVTVSSSEGDAVLSGIFAGGGFPAPISDNPLAFHVLGADSTGMRVRISGDSGQRFKVQRTTDFQTWTEVANSILLSTSTEMTLSGEIGGGFFRTVNAP